MSDESHIGLLDTLDAVLFDLDGTLLDTAPDLVGALWKVCDEQEQDRPEFRSAANQVSNGARGLVEHAFAERGEEEKAALIERLVDIYAEHICIDTRPYPGMLQLLDDLEKRNIAWGVVTNKMHRLALPILEALDLAARCKTIVGGDTAARNKPHPDPILHALDELSLAAASVAYVGDHRKDVLAGQAAGTTTIAVTWGYVDPKEDPYSWGADYTIERAEDLLGL